MRSFPTKCNRNGKLGTLIGWSAAGCDRALSTSKGQLQQLCSYFLDGQGTQCWEHWRVTTCWELLEGLRGPQRDQQSPSSLCISQQTRMKWKGLSWRDTSYTCCLSDNLFLVRASPLCCLTESDLVSPTPTELDEHMPVFKRGKDQKPELNMVISYRTYAF